MSDLDALATESEREKARGFVERSGLVITGALPQSEMAKLRRVMPLSQAESARLVSWADPGSWSRVSLRIVRRMVRPVRLLVLVSSW